MVNRRQTSTAIMAADVAGYSRLSSADEEGTHRQRKSHLAELIEPAVAAHGGRIVKGTSDGLLTEFPSAVTAVAYKFRDAGPLVRLQQGLRLAGIPDKWRSDPLA
jgi:class 3 adenylate cyclase